MERKNVCMLCKVGKGGGGDEGGGKQTDENISQIVDGSKPAASLALRNPICLIMISRNSHNM